MDSFEISSDNYDPSSLNSPAQQTGGRVPGLNENRSGSQRIASSVSEIHNTQYSKENTTKREASVDTMSTATRWKIFAGILLIVAAAYLLIVSISYFAHGADDQSLVQGRDFVNIASDSDKVLNTGGPLGAYLSDLLLSRWLGIGSFIIIFYIGALGISLVRIHHFKFWDLTYKCLLTAITLSILTGFVTYAFTSHNYWGGDHGYMVNKFIIDKAGIFGAIGLNILLVAAVALVFMRQIQMAYTAYRRRVERHREKLAREKAESEARRRKREKMMTPNPIPVQEETKEPVFDDSFVRREETPVNQTNIETQQIETVQNTPDITDSITQTDIQEPVTSTIINESPDNSVEDSQTTLEDIPIDTDTEIPTEENDLFIPLINKEPVSDDNTDETINDTVEEQEEIKSDKEVAEPFRDTYDPTLELSRFRFPSIDLLDDKIQRTDHVDMLEQEENKARLTETLRTFGVKISHIEATVGPTITRYEIIPAEGVRTRSVKSLGEDLALTLQALGVRIIAPIPGKGTIGIEVPNKDPQTVYIRNILASDTFQNFQGELPIALGTTITNDVYVADLAKLPHLLVAGATGMGKSVGLNTIITSLLYKKHPAELKFVLVDPKRVELSLYRTLERHYLAALPGEDSIITDMSKVVTVLNSLCKEMEDRLGLLQAAEVRNIKEYNTKFIAKKLNPKKHRFLPYIVLIIDEFADIILTQGKEVENPVSRLAAVARAAGIHLIIATQRPSVNVITGGIKTNIPGRMAFRVNQGVDSRTIIDQVGANLLNGKGDMLFSRDGIIDRVQGAFISTDEVKAIVDSIGEQIGYDEPYQLPEYVDPNTENGPARSGALTDRDPMFEEAGRLVVNSNSGSTTMLQRKLAIGFGRAARIMDQLEIAGVVGPAQGGKPRDVLMDMYAFERYLNPPPPTSE